MSRGTSERRLPVLGSELLEPLRPAGVVDGRQVFQVGQEALFSNDDLVAPLQRFPGDQLGVLQGRNVFPVPDRVGEYCSRDEFIASSKYMAQWVHWPKRAEMVLEGRYWDISPVHFEGIFTLACNFMCPHCSRRVTRTKWVEGGTWEHNSEIDRRNTMHPYDLRRTLDEVASLREDQQMGIVWGGGDPTANPFTYDAMLYARSLGISSSFLTNGVFLDVERVLEAEPILVRISLNCGTEKAYQRFHGYPPGWPYFEEIKKRMRELARAKLETDVRTLVGVSLIVDERNMEDVVAAAAEIRAIVDDAGPGIDYVIVRPVFNYSHFDREYARLQDDTKRRALELVSEGGRAHEMITSLGIPLILIKDSFEAPPSEEFYGNDARCLAYGMFSEIRHNGDVQLCSDSYGNPEYTIGNLSKDTMREIWKSPRRQEVLAQINARQCYKRHCAHNSRGHHYNRVFHQIERMREDGRMDEVRRWVEDLREVTLPLGHSFFT